MCKISIRTVLFQDFFNFRPYFRQYFHCRCFSYIYLNFKTISFLTTYDFSRYSIYQLISLFNFLLLLLFLGLINLCSCFYSIIVLLFFTILDFLTKFLQQSLSSIFNNIWIFLHYFFLFLLKCNLFLWSWQFDQFCISNLPDILLQVVYLFCNIFHLFSKIFQFVLSLNILTQNISIVFLVYFYSLIFLCCFYLVILQII